MDLSCAHSIRLLVLKEALSERPSNEFIYRKICRKVAKTFNISLLEVYDMESEEVFKLHFEHEFDEMSEDRPKLLELAEELTRTEAERIAAQHKEDKDAVDDALFAKAADAEASRPKALPAAVNRPAISTTARDRDVSLPDVKLTPPPDLKMSFISMEELESIANSDSLGGALINP